MSDLADQPRPKYQVQRPIDYDLMMENNLLSLIIFAPLAGAVINWFVGRRLRNEKIHRRRRLRAVGISTIVAFYLAFKSDGALRSTRTDPRSPLDVDTGRQLPRGLRPGDGPPERHLRALRHLRRLADSPLRGRLHARRQRLLPLLRLSEPVHVLDADARAGGQFPADVRRLGRRRALLVPADRLLHRAQGSRRRGEESVHHEPHRRLGRSDRHLSDLLR